MVLSDQRLFGPFHYTIEVRLYAGQRTFIGSMPHWAATTWLVTGSPTIFRRLQLKHTTALIWFRDDLRVHDHEAIARAHTRNMKTIAVFCFDPSISEVDEYGFPRVGKHRLRFLQETVANLRDNLAAIGIPLVICFESPAVAIPRLAIEHHAEVVYAQKALTPKEILDERHLGVALGPNTRLSLYSGQFLIHPDDLPFELSDFPSYFSTFRKVVEKKCEPRELFEIDPQDDDTVLHPDDLLAGPAVDFRAYTRDPRSCFPFRGGETHALYRVNEYLWDSKHVTRYKDMRNDLSGVNSSTKFSSWLANGSLSPRYVYSEMKRFEKKVVQNSSTYWVIYELLWRDFYKYILLIHGPRIFDLNGVGRQPYKFRHDPALIDRWISGNTGEPVVDAAMIELKTTGWLSARARKITASYFCHDLEQDWRIGAAWFASQLLDLDAASNWGNWMFAAGVSCDQERSNRLNIRGETDRYDPDGAYRSRWIKPATHNPKPETRAASSLAVPGKSPDRVQPL